MRRNVYGKRHHETGVTYGITKGPWTNKDRDKTMTPPAVAVHLHFINIPDSESWGKGEDFTFFLTVPGDWLVPCAPGKGFNPV